MGYVNIAIFHMYATDYKQPLWHSYLIFTCIMELKVAGIYLLVVLFNLSFYTQSSVLLGAVNVITCISHADYMLFDCPILS